MQTSLPISELPFTKKLIKDLIAKPSKLEKLGSEPLSLDGLKAKAAAYNFDPTKRTTLVEVLEEQHAALDLFSLQRRNLTALQNDTTFTLCTGHQLNIFTGPLYCVIKILQTVKTCDAFNKENPDTKCVPIFWLASEDHDFEEINHFWWGNKKFNWDTKSGNATGRIPTKGILEKVSMFFDQFKAKSTFQQQLEDLFMLAYSQPNLALATRVLVHELLGEYGVLILDADDKRLKEQMKAVWKQELSKKNTFKNVNDTNEFLKHNDYHIQVNAREINLFWLENQRRKRIVEEDGVYYSLNNNKAQEISRPEKHPYKISPNALLRPLYQQYVLPNLAYIGGAGEISYWLQLKSTFDSFSVPFPILVTRNSILVRTKKQNEKQHKLGIENKDWFLPEHRLIQQKVAEWSDLNIPFDTYEGQLKSMFEELKTFAEHTDPTFGNMIMAQEAKQLKGLGKMKKRMLKAERKKSDQKVKRIKELRQALYPHGKLQERHYNFATFYSQTGPDFFELIYKALTVFEPKMHFVEIPVEGFQ